MSFTVYNGYKFPVLPLPDIHEGIQLMRKTLSELAIAKQKQRQISLATGILDRHALGLPNDGYPGYLTAEEIAGHSPLSLAFKITEKLHKSKRREPEDDYACELILFPRQDKNLAILFADDERFLDVLTKTPWFQGHIDLTPYPYWDNSDPDENVTEAEWQQRKMEWDEALKNHTPAMSGFTATLTPPTILPIYKEEIQLKDLPTKETRVASLARSAAINARMKGQTPENPATHEIVNALSEASEWLGTKEGQQSIEDYKITIDSQLLSQAESFDAMFKPLQNPTPKA